MCYGCVLAFAAALNRGERCCFEVEMEVSELKRSLVRIKHNVCNIKFNVRILCETAHMSISRRSDKYS